VYPNASTTCKTLSRVVSTTLSGVLKHLETVAVDTSAILATSCSEGAELLFFIFNYQPVNTNTKFLIL
jgi:hypothetical protein